MAPPLFSTFSLITELIVTASVFYVFYSGYKFNKFPFKIAFFALAYETLVNITYMAKQMVEEVEEHSESLLSGPEIILAISHGILSLIMFLTLVTFVSVAARNYRKGINYFREHKKLTYIFLIFWSISVISGITLYFLMYNIF